MATFGQTAVGATPGAFGNAALSGDKFTMPASGKITRISAYIDALVGTISAKACIYADVAGVPGALLAQSPGVAGITTTPGWVHFSMNYNGVGGTVYWLALLSDADFNIHYNAGGANQHDYVQQPGVYPNPPDPWPADNWGNIVSSIYATYGLSTGNIVGKMMEMI